MKLTVAEIAELTGAKISLPDSLTNMSEAEKYVIDGVDNLKNAQASQASVWKDAKYRRQFAETSAGVVFVSELQSDVAVLQLVHSHPGVAFAEFIQHLYPDQKPVKTEISPMASVSESATVGENVCIHAGAFVGENAVIGNGVTLHAGSFVGDGAVVGAGTVLHANSVLEYGCVTGTGCKLFAGAIVGGDGFGYVAEPPGQNATHPAGRVLKVPQIGNVVLGDRVEIGATSTVDRAAFGSTELGNDVKIDSRVQIAHNCKIGDCTAFSGMSGVAGSTTIGKWCLVGGGVLIKDHIEITDGVQIAAMSVVGRSIRDPGQYAGDPVVPIDVWRRNKLKQAREARR